MAKRNNLLLEEVLTAFSETLYTMKKRNKNIDDMEIQTKLILREVVEVDLTTLRVMEEMLEVVEIILVMVEILVEEEAMVGEVVAAEPLSCSEPGVSFTVPTPRHFPRL
ncbi:hypothetical protein A6R68_05016 [Neotoma lepida]|uniref:Uncharacterized protein n=1 Tax=Neotoma lepida TaxID=56216 RepID=A0A1A6GJJ8_NEOLE|nr:hypothetical protein A6R68_05016 [Neotoma lepida]